MADLDDRILASCSPRWQKVAMIIAKVAAKHRLDGIHDDHDAIAASVQQLIGAGLLEAAGNLADWRASEIRLSQSQK